MPGCLRQCPGLPQPRPSPVCRPASAVRKSFRFRVALSGLLDARAEQAVIRICRYGSRLEPKLSFRPYNQHNRGQKQQDQAYKLLRANLLVQQKQAPACGQKGLGQG